MLSWKRFLLFAPNPEFRVHLSLFIYNERKRQILTQKIKNFFRAKKTGSTEISPSSRGAWKDKTSTVCNIGSPIGVDLLEISDILVREGTVCGIDYHGRI